MKNNNWLLLVCFILTAFSGYAQLNIEIGLNENQFKNLQIGYSKTTSIVFPYSIKSIDRGSQDILTQKAKGAENILLIKARQKNFVQTNLTIVTSDGKLYVFILNYNDQCPDLNLTADNSIAINREILFSEDSENQKRIKEFSELALTKKNKLSGLRSERFDIKLQVSGIFIHQDVMYFRVILENNSKINYDISQLRFFIRDQKKSKRTASQEIEIIPLLSTPNINSVSDESEISAVYAFPKFTISDNKYLTVQLIEKNGGRHLEINIKKNMIDQVFPIP
ncbi:conjugative transposon protein TraN [Flavobacterium sp. 3-210]